ncbi:MAG: hypothetical protein HFI76_01555 [Lachnospiraceae bacterium]|nr:hypothetical protein [Lachnospiraceae bacterium]
MVILRNGPSSSGKSTLTKLLQRELEARTGEAYGVISIDEFLPMSVDTKI